MPKCSHIGTSGFDSAELADYSTSDWFPIVGLLHLHFILIIGQPFGSIFYLINERCRLSGMPHKIEVFSADCPLCNNIANELEAGRCAKCELIIRPISENLSLAQAYEVRVVPTVIIDGEVKIEGKPDIPFVCSDETYAHFKQKYPLTLQLEGP